MTLLMKFPPVSKNLVCNLPQNHLRMLLSHWHSKMTNFILNTSFLATEISPIKWTWLVANSYFSISNLSRPHVHATLILKYWSVYICTIWKRPKALLKIFQNNIKSVTFSGQSQGVIFEHIFSGNVSQKKVRGESYIDLYIQCIIKTLAGVGEENYQ